MFNLSSAESAHRVAEVNESKIQNEDFEKKIHASMSQFKKGQQVLHDQL